MGVEGLNISKGLPVGDAVDELFIGDGHAVVSLSLLDFNLDLVVFSKVSDLLYLIGPTLESMHPFLMPSLFMATKFLEGSLTDETLCSCQPETTDSMKIYLPLPRIGLWWGPFRRCARCEAVRGSRSCSCRVQPSEGVHFLWTSDVQL